LIAEATDNGIEYTKLVAEKADQGIEFTKYIANESNSRWAYQQHMNEQLDNVISHNDYIVEGTSSIIEYTEYLKENTQNLAGYLNHIVKEINEGKVSGLEGSQSIDENTIFHSTPKRTILSKVEGNEEDTFERTLTNKLNSILENAKTVNESVDANKLHFLNFFQKTKETNLRL